MATVNKDFKIKNGLVVEGSTATVNGNQILTETASDQYIIDLIGGETLITSVESTQMEVTNGELNIKSGVFDPAGSADTAEDNANTYTDTAITNALAPGGSILNAIDTAVPDNTDGLSEGSSNLYYSDSRVEGVLSNSAGMGLDWNPNTNSFDINASGAVGDSSVSGLTVYPGTGPNAISFVSIDRNTVDTWYDANGAAGDVQDNLDDHTGASSGVHGITGAVVGTTDTQDLSNKRFIDTVYFTDGTTIANEGEIAIRSGSHEFDIQANYGNLNLESTAGDITLTPASGHHVYVGGATAGNEVATHSYVDNAISGLDWKQAVNLLATSNIDLNQDTPSVDSHAPSDGYRYLLTGQSTDSENGIYVYSAVSKRLTRTEDADAHGELVGAAVFVMEGTTYGGSSWVQGNHYLTDFTGQDWAQFSGSGTVTAGTGIDVNGLEVSIDRTTVDGWYEASGAVSTHSDLTTGVHGVTGTVVGTSDQQTLTNKTIDGGSNSISNIANSSLLNDSITVNGNVTALGDSVTLYSDDVLETSGGNNLYFTQSRARESLSAGNAISYNNGTGEIAVDASQLDTDDITEGATNQYFTDSRAVSAIDSAITGGTQTNISVSYNTNTQKFDFVAENGVADSDTDDLTEGSTNLYFTDQRALDAVSGSDISPATVTIDTYRKEEATQQYVANASTVNVHSLPAGFESAKYLVRVVGNVSGTKHSQLTEILLTIDGNNNVAITEYGTICTDTNNLASFSAGVSSGSFVLTATTAVAGCEIIAAATMLSWAD